MKKIEISAIMNEDNYLEKAGEIFSMIFKVFFQQKKTEVPVRERTQTIYIEAESEREVRAKLAERNLNIEFIQMLDKAHLEYEKQSENFVLENV